MPEDRAFNPIEAVNLDSEPLKLSVDDLNEKYALALVKESFDLYESYRSNFSDQRWNVADGLFTGWVPGKFWEGTTIPRASLGYPIVFSQIEAALPAISQEIFTPQDDWFQVEAEPGTKIEEARQVQEHMSYVLEHAKNDYSQTARNEMEVALQQILMYGNGGISLEYDSILQRPIIQWVDIRDFYIDPGCPVPNIDEARSVIRRKMMTIDELVLRRQDPRMKIPEDDVLYHMSKNPLFATADQTKRNQAAIRGENYTPGVTDYAPNPADRKIEVLLYYTASRIIWVLNREAVIYNEENPYGFIPFCFAPCYIFPGRFYAMSLADVQEGNQRYIEALFNGRLDALTLELQPPRVYKAGTMLTPAQLKWKPGAGYGMSDPKDMSLLQPNSGSANVFSEIAFISSSAEQLTGVNSMQSGIPRPSNTNRTATGVSAVQSGSSSRLRYLVANFENYLVVPMLYKLYSIIQKHTKPGTALTGINKEGQLTQANSNSFQGPMRFRMLASSKMMTREKLAAMFPFITQYMLNGTFLGGLQKQGSTIDFNEMFRMLQDATGTGRLYNFIRPMSQQEQQALNQPPPEVMMQSQQQDKELQTRQQMGQMKSQTDLQIAQMKNQPNPQELQQDQQRMQMEMEREASRVKSEQMLAQIKMYSEQQKAANDAKSKQQELAFKQQESGMKLQSSAMEHSLNLRQQQQQAAMQNQQMQDQHAQTMEQGQQTHEVGLENMKREGEEKAKMRKRAEVHKKPGGPKA